MDGRCEAVFQTTNSVIGAFCKCPHASAAYTSSKKFGFFYDDHMSAEKIFEELGMEKKSDTKHVAYHRHPLAFITEAADDICYHLSDIEDAVKYKLETV